MARLVDRALHLVWPLTRVFDILRRFFRFTIMREESRMVEIERLNVSNKAGALFNIDFPTIFNLDPGAETERPLEIDLNLDQLENFED